MTVCACLVAVSYVVILAPIGVLIFSSFDGGEVFRFPPKSYSLRWYDAAVHSREYRSHWASACSRPWRPGPSPGTLAAMRRPPLPRRRWRLPSPPLRCPIVWAIALLQIYAWLGISGSFPGLFIAHATITIPFSVRIMTANFSQLDPNLVAAAASLGAPPSVAFRRIRCRWSHPVWRSAPRLVPGLLQRRIVSSFIAGARWITFPVRLYSELRSEGVDPITVAIGAAIVALILVAALGGERLFKWSRQL
jgi:putative spermidine/putrescine transport system permease protein